MAVTRAPKRQPAPAVARPQQDEQEVLDVIQRGGSVQADRATPAMLTDQQKSVQLRLYQSILNEIDDLRKRSARGRRPVSRHAWILQAIEEKLEMERRKEY